MSQPGNAAQSGKIKSRMSIFCGGDWNRASTFGQISIWAKQDAGPILGNYDSNTKSTVSILQAASKQAMNTC